MPQDMHVKILCILCTGLNNIVCFHQPKLTTWKHINNSIFTHSLSIPQELNFSNHPTSNNLQLNHGIHDQRIWMKSYGP